MVQDVCSPPVKEERDFSHVRDSQGYQDWFRSPLSSHSPPSCCPCLLAASDGHEYHTSVTVFHNLAAGRYWVLS